MDCVHVDKSIFHSQDVEELRQLIYQYERKSRKTSWLLRQLWFKLIHFPRDLSRRLRRSKQKKQRCVPKDVIMIGAVDHMAQTAEPVASIESAAPQISHPFLIAQHRLEAFELLRQADLATEASLADISSFLHSPLMRTLIDKATQIDPEIGSIDEIPLSYCPAWADDDYYYLRELTDRIPRDTYDAVILMPAGRMGGADLVAGILTKVLSRRNRTIILRTDDAHWERPDWYPADTPSIDLSDILRKISNPTRALYVLLSEIGAKKIFNVNSRRTFETFVAYGSRLAVKHHLYAYYFCADRTPQGLEAGYPVWFFANLLPVLKAAIIDTKVLADTLIARHAIPKTLLARIHTIYTPAQLEIADPPVAAIAAERETGSRPKIIWAGRLDRQKRFDLVKSIACAMRDVDFLCWGKAVLDAPPDVRYLPPNIKLHQPFTNYDELPFASAVGVLYTSEWDGLPTLLIEVGALGVPVVASAVGGVPELIDASTGWPIDAAADIREYVIALREMITNRDERVRRARALQERVRANHSELAYARAIETI